MKQSNQYQLNRRYYNDLASGDDGGQAWTAVWVLLAAISAALWFIS